MQIPAAERLVVETSGGTKFVVNNANGSIGSVLQKAMTYLDPTKQGSDFVTLPTDKGPVFLITRHIAAIYAE